MTLLSAFSRRLPTPFPTVVVIAAFLASAAHAVGQTRDRAEINGTIQDETKAALGGVTVTLREMKTGFERTMVTVGTRPRCCRSACMSCKQNVPALQTPRAIP
jgi:hypothetical protein